MRTSGKARTADILAAELSKLGGPLAGWMSRRMPNNIGEARAPSRAAPAFALRTASIYIEQHGRVLAQSANDLSGVVGGGRLNLNPVHVQVQVHPTEHGTSEIVVRAVAKEGLSKQFAGETTAQLLVQHIVNTVPD